MLAVELTNQAPAGSEDRHRRHGDAWATGSCVVRARGTLQT